MQDLNVLVLAAGRSTRIRSAHTGPKPLLEIEGVSVLERDLRWLAEAGVKNLWINLHFEPDQIRGRIGTGERLGLTINYSVEPSLLGTAGALRALPFASGTTLVVYGDNLVRFDLQRFLAHHRERGAQATLALFDTEVHPHTGVAGGRVGVSEQGDVVLFEERPGVEHLVNAGVYLLEPAVVGSIPADHPEYDFGRDLFPRLLREGWRLQGYLIDGYCLGLDTPESLAQARALIESRQVNLP